MMICENCGKEHNGCYGSGRFCCETCARSFSCKKVQDSELKEAICCSCGKLIFIKKRASSKLCRCVICNKLRKVVGKIYFEEHHQHLINELIKEKPSISLYNKLQRIGQLTNTDISNDLKRIEEYFLKQGYHKICVHRNGRVFGKLISPELHQKFSNAGLKSSKVQSETRRSKNEIYFCELCKQYFNNVLHNVQMFNGWDADIIIDDIKIAVLWNGKWHYEKIKKAQSLKQIQNRDNIKLEEIKKCEYIPYVIKDLGSYNRKFVNKKFEEFLNFIENLS